MNSSLVFLHNVSYVLRGIVVHLFISTIVLINTPIYFYRFLITKVLAPRYDFKLGKVVDTASQQFAVDFHEPISQPRNTIVGTTVYEGTISFTDFCQAVDANCIKARDSKRHLLYPELQQYIESWMGFMFWKHDKSFSLRKHLFLHQLQENISAENWIDDFVETLINQPYPLKQSPWEIHLIQNVKLDFLSDKTQASKSSVLVFKVHHAMADGYSLMQCFIESLCGNPLQNLSLAQASRAFTSKSFIPYLTLPLRYFYRLGWITSRIPKQPKSLLVLDSKKAWHQTFARGKLIPLQTVKTIKKKLNVSVAAVLNCAISAALSKFCQERKDIDNGFGRSMLIGNVAIRPNRPGGITNHSNGLTLEVPLTDVLSPFQRLRLCQDSVALASTAPLSCITKLLLGVFATNLASVVKSTAKNNYIAVGLSNFAGPGTHFYWDGKNKAVDTYTIAGAFNGQSGMMFVSVGYVDGFRICLTVEKALCSKDAADKLLKCVYEEINELLKLALSIPEIK